MNFNWRLGAPDPSMGVDTFSVRWTGFVQPPQSVPPGQSQAITFFTTSDDGVRLSVNGQLVIDNWTDHGAVENAGTITLTAGKKVAIKMEYYERGANASASLSWSSATQAKQIIPAVRLFPN